MTHAVATHDTSRSDYSSMITQAGLTTSDPQRRRALEKANAVRLARAALKRRILAGDLTAAEVILEPPAEAASWPVGELLASQRRWGATRCRKFLGRNQIPETKPLKALTERQKTVLAVALGAEDPGRREMGPDLREEVTARREVVPEAGETARGERVAGREMALV